MYECEVEINWGVPLQASNIMMAKVRRVGIDSRIGAFFTHNALHDNNTTSRTEIH